MDSNLNKNNKPTITVKKHFLPCSIFEGETHTIEFREKIYPVIIHWELEYDSVSCSPMLVIYSADDYDPDDNSGRRYEAVFKLVQTGETFFANGFTRLGSIKIPGEDRILHLFVDVKRMA